MARTVDELTFDYEDQGQLVRKELKKVVLSKGAWATVMFYYQDLDRKTGMYREPKGLAIAGFVIGLIGSAWIILALIFGLFTMILAAAGIAASQNAP